MNYILPWLEKNKIIDIAKKCNVQRYMDKNKVDEIQAALETGVCTKDEVMQAVKGVHDLETFNGDIECLRVFDKISITAMEERKYIIAYKNGSLTDLLVLITDPVRRKAIREEVQSETRVSSNIELVFIFKDDFDKWLVKNSNKLSGDKLQSYTNDFVVEDSIDEETDDFDDVDQSEIEKIVNTIFSDAVTRNASDIRIIRDKNETEVQFCIDGDTRTYTTLNKSIHENIINKIMIMTKTMKSEKREAQDGQISTKINGKEVTMRVTSDVLKYGTRMIIRVLVNNGSEIKSLEELGFNKLIAKQIREKAAEPYGIIILSGPTGSGKSSTMAAILNEKTYKGKVILSYEDPIEYEIPGVEQYQINTEKGETFAIALKRLVRQSPNIVMIGEMRDNESAQIAINASQTGHLILTTVHSNNAAGIVERLNSLDIKNAAISSATCFINQRLVKKLCNKCKKEHVIDIDDISKYGLANSLLGQTVYEPCGCSECTNGYKGRTVVAELIDVDDKIGELITEGGSKYDIEREAIKHGMVPIKECGKSLVIKGITSFEEITKVLGGR